MKRSPLSQKPSRKRRPEIAARKRLIAAMKRNGPVLCAWQVPVWDYAVIIQCTGYADDLHEILSRARGGSISDPANCIPLCRPHHTWVTEHPIEAKEMGLSK